MKKKILISSGGSGGHVIPAISFYDHLKKDFDVFLTLDVRGAEFINQNKYKYEILNSPRLTFDIIKLPITIIILLMSVLKSIRFLKNKKINIILSTGGYMSIPLCLAAKILNIKIFLFEPNIIIGRANKFLLKFSDKIFCYSDEIINFPIKYKNKIIIINHLLRKEIYNYKNNNKEKTENRLKLLVVGGSQGAKIFDEEIKDTIIELSNKYKIKVFHQSSEKNLKILKFFYDSNNVDSELFNFKENIFNYINEANLAVTRSGALTLSELVFLRVPFIAVPYKFATDNHQLKNALYYKNKDCCWIIEEKEFNNNKLTALLLKIIEDKYDYSTKKNNIQKFYYQNTWNNINQKIVRSINEN